ncbi:NAD(P)-dependent oxidoreductase [Streptomyces sp. NPDC050504]|uniref:NAD(P)-dependent oxidoreductase n=1 Tax=Streptomyces sp. NPDC050504 TaxID=3365618 RepID=UPI00379B22B0
MGAALADAYLAAGHPTTVWNRTPHKADRLVAKGAVFRPAVEDAVAASPLVVTCLTTYRATFEALAPARAALADRTLVTLNSGTPSGAREAAAWAAESGARFLDGAVKNVPTAVGLPDTLLYYSGDKAVFNTYEAVLRVMGGDTRHLGAEPDLAALYESAVGTTLLPVLLGYFQAAAMVKQRGLDASTLVPYTAKWLEMVISLLPHYADEIDRGSYTDPLSSLGLFHESIAHDQELAEETGVDYGWHEPMHELLRRGVAEGHAEHSVAALYELLKPR